MFFNKKTIRNYFVKKKIEAGIVLNGWEIRSIRDSKFNFENCFVSVKNSEAYIVGSVIVPVKGVLLDSQQERSRMRKLLLNRKEIDLISCEIEKVGYSAIIISLYLKNNIYKVQIGIVKGKKKYDKRYEIRKLEWNNRRKKFLKNTLKKYFYS
ncbi:hypothetical protein AOQ88_01085 [Candidatus Riesia sp. GBBU]|nr:hypothetical protein AOQ88_01085 [Candidatus Riesia sp. GBBU]